MASNIEKNFLDILEDLKTTTGTNDKIAILKANENNVQLKEYFQLALDNKITFGVAKTPEVLASGRQIYDNETTWKMFIELANKLANRELTGNAAISAIGLFFAGTENYYWYAKCLEKDLAVIGIGRSTVEKVWPNLCGKFKCNLAEEEAELPKFDWSNGASIEIKLNGIRTLTQIEVGDIAWIKGRSGLEIETFYPIIEDIKKILYFDNFVLDGEVHCENNLQKTQTVFGTIVNLSRGDFKTDKAYAKWVEEKQKVALELRNKCTYDIFDILPIDEFNSQTCSRGYLGRRLLLQELQRKLIEAGITKIRVVDSIPVKNKDEAVAVANGFMADGLEGGILKANSAKYEYKRARNFIKIKECTGEFEAEIVGIEISKDIYKTDGTLDLPQAGKIILKYKNPSGTYSQSGCGTGKWLTKAKKEEIAADPNAFMYKIVTVSAQCFSADNIALVPRIERDRPDRTSLEE